LTALGSAEIRREARRAGIWLITSVTGPARLCLIDPPQHEQDAFLSAHADLYAHGVNIAAMQSLAALVRSA